MMVNAGINKEGGALALAAVPENPEDAEGCAAIDASLPATLFVCC